MELQLFFVVERVQVAFPLFFASPCPAKRRRVLKPLYPGSGTYARSRKRWDCKNRS